MIMNTRKSDQARALYFAEYTEILTKANVTPDPSGVVESYKYCPIPLYPCVLTIASSYPIYHPHGFERHYTL